MFQHRYDEALDALDSLELEYPMHSLGDGSPTSATTSPTPASNTTPPRCSWEKLLELYPLDILVDNALLDLWAPVRGQAERPGEGPAVLREAPLRAERQHLRAEARNASRRLRGDLPAPEEFQPPASDPHP